MASSSTVVDGQVIAADDHNTVRTDALTNHGAFVFVAASDAPQAQKDAADYLCDGTDDQTQIQAALDDVVAAGGGVVQLSDGTFVGDALLTADVTGLWFRGTTVQSTKLNWTGDFFDFGTLTEQIVSFKMSDMQITESGGVSTTATGIETLSAITKSCHFENLRISGFGGGEIIINGVSNLYMLDVYISHNRASGTGNGLKVIGQSGASWGVVAITLVNNYFASTVAGANPMAYFEDVNTGRFIGNIYENVPSGVVGFRMEATSGNTAQDCVFIGEHYESISGTAWQMHDVENVTVLNSRGATPAFSWSAVATEDQRYILIGAFQNPEIIATRLLLGLTGPNDLIPSAAIQIGPVRGGTFAEAFMSKEADTTGDVGVWSAYAQDTGGTDRKIVTWAARMVAQHASLPSSEFLVQAVNAAGGSLGTVFRVGAAGTQLGSGSSTFTKMLKGTALWNPASLDDAQTATTTVTVTGATQNSSAVFVGFNAITGAGWVLSGVVTGADTVTVTLTNHTGGTVNLGEGTVTAWVVLS